MARQSSSSAVAMLILAALLSPAPAALSLPLPVPMEDAAAGGLSPDFHAGKCKQLEPIVRAAVQAALQQDIALAAGLLRIFFHDCFPQGCDASVYLKGGKTEQAMGPNSTLQQKAMDLVEAIRAKVHAACGATVSCADISSLATRDAVVLSGGPTYAPPLGQLDSLAPAAERLVNDLPSPATAAVSDLLDAFGTRGLGEPADLVALSGAHTVGRAHCPFFADRSRRQDDTFSRKLAVNCSKDPSRLQNLDVRTPDLFDNAYYVALTDNQGVFTSDMALVKDGSTAPFVRQFAKDKNAFFTQFAKSMLKLSKVPRPAGNVGEIRRSCFRTNSGRVADSDEGFAAAA